MLRRSVISLILALLILTGCSRTVTQLVTFGTQLRVEVTLRGNFDVTRNRYFMVIATQEAYYIPLPAPYSTDEFLEPGDAAQAGDTARYYTDYYYSWHSYIVLNQMGYFLNKGPFVYGVSTTPEVISGTGNISNKLTFSVELERIFGPQIPDYIYFDLISVDYPSGQLKYLKDNITPPVRSISKVSGSFIQAATISNEAIDGSQDIISWSVRIE